MNCHNIDDYLIDFWLIDDCQNEIVMEAGRLDDVEAIWIVIAVAAYTQDVLSSRVARPASCHDLFIINSLSYLFPLAHHSKGMVGR